MQCEFLSLGSSHELVFHKHPSKVWEPLLPVVRFCESLPQVPPISLLLQGRTSFLQSGSSPNNCPNRFLWDYKTLEWLDHLKFC